MYSFENYIWGLIAYYLGVIMVLLCLYHFRALIPWKHVRNVILILVAVMLLVPVTAYPDSDFLAPAWFVSVYATLLGETEEIIRALVPLIILETLAIFIYILVAVVLWKRQAKIPVENTGRKNN